MHCRPIRVVSTLRRQTFRPFWLLLLALVLALPVPSGRGWAAAPLKLTILHINDVYEIQPRHGRGGLASLMTLLERRRADAEATLTTFGGDLFSPSLLSAITQGAHMVEMFNRLGVDLAVVGNHEFDFGTENAVLLFGRSRFPWLAGNMRRTDGTPVPNTRDWDLRTIGPYRIGFFGVITPETATLSSPGPLDFQPVIESAQRLVEILKQRKADIIIALTHLPLALDRALADQVPDVSVILGGHDHEPMMVLAKDTLIFKAGANAHYLGVVELNLKTVAYGAETKVIVTPEWHMLANRHVVPDPDIAAEVARYDAKLQADLNETIGRSETQLDSRTRTVRLGESTMGNLVADAMRISVGADIALTNGGGLRGDRVYRPESVLTRHDILNELPFGNVTVLLEITGTDLLAALENGLSALERAAGRFPQISGMTVRYDPEAPPGRRVRSVLIGDGPLAAEGRYRLATNDYLLRGGDGYTSLAGARALIDPAGGTLVATAVMAFIAARGSIAPRIEGRLLAESEPLSDE